MRRLTQSVQRIGARTALTFGLVWLSAAAMAWQAADSSRLLDRESLLGFTTVVFAGVWLLARTRTAGRTAMLMVPLACLLVVFVRSGSMEAKLATVLIEAAKVTGSVLFDLARFSPFALMDALRDLAASVIALAARTIGWIVDNAAGRPTPDPVAQNLLWALAVSINAAWAAWQQRRLHQAISALLPSLLAICGIAYGLNVYPALLLFPLFSMLSVHVLTTYHRRESGWSEERVDFSEDVRLDVAVIAGGLIVLLVLAAGLAPSVRLQDVLHRAQTLVRGLVAVQSAPGPSPAGGLESGARLPEGMPSPFEPMRVTGLPRRHLIGSGPELSRQVMFTARLLTDDLPAPSAPYWRSLTYDQYIGIGWATSHVESSAHRAGESLVEELPSGHRRISQIIERAGDQTSFLYATGALNGADQPYVVGRRTEDDFFGALIDALAYRADSSALAVDESWLVASDGTIPAWVRDRYLALPEETPPRILALARSLTAAEPTVYARARAIERYLRTYSYTLDLPVPPIGRDIADYFLFELRRGYCDYFATAMVVLARGAGIPSRLVTGYAPGTRDASTGVFTITAANAHSWAEVYIGSLGWVEFEPTSGYPPIERISGEPPQQAERGGPLFTIPALELAGVVAWAGGAAVLGAFTWLAARALSDLRDNWRLRHGRQSEVITAIYVRVRLEGKRLGVVPRESETPTEGAARIADAIAQRVQHADATARLGTIAEAYGRATYRRGGATADDALDAGAAYRRLRPLISEAQRHEWKTKLGAMLRSRPFRSQ